MNRTYQVIVQLFNQTISSVPLNVDYRLCQLKWIFLLNSIKNNEFQKKIFITYGYE